jgi:L-ribulokinase
MAQYLIGLDFGTESARGVRISAETGLQEASVSHPYRHGVMQDRLPNGAKLPPAYALQDADDYLEAAQVILRELGKGREVASIGLDFTASSPLPAKADGTPLSRVYRANPHAYVKLWKHAAAQPDAEVINATPAAFHDGFEGTVSGEWLLAKAAQIEREDRVLWQQADRFIEAGDWLVWQLSGREARSLDFAAFKAQYDAVAGYPDGLVADLAGKLASPHVVGTAAGQLSAEWRALTGIEGDAVIAVASIDSHAVLPAVHANTPHTLLGAIGTSAAYLYLTDRGAPLPAGVEGVAENAALPGLWCYEAGQAAFGDLLGWFVRSFPRAETIDENFQLYNAAAAKVSPGEHPIIAIDWWSGNRVPYADSALSGVLAGLTLQTSGAAIYRALLEGLCFGMRTVVDHLEAGHLPVDRIIVTSGLSLRNPLLIQIMADVLGRRIEVPQVDNATCVGAAIHGAVAAGLVADFSAGAARFGSRHSTSFEPDRATARVYSKLYQQYCALVANGAMREALRNLRAIAGDAFAASHRSAAE